MSETKEYLFEITLDEGSIIRRTPEVDHERAVAIADLIEHNNFAPTGMNCGPYRAHLSILENRLLIDISPEQKTLAAMKVVLPMQPFRSVIKDYFMICESYFEAIKTASPSKIEAIDMGRRGLHNEGSETLKSLLKDKIVIDFETSRRLFTLICVLHIK